MSRGESQGETKAEALENIHDAIREYLAASDELMRHRSDDVV